MQICVELLGQHLIGFSGVGFQLEFPARVFKNIKTTLYRAFSYTMLPRASRTTLHRDLTCSRLSG